MHYVIDETKEINGQDKDALGNYLFPSGDCS